MLVVFTSCSSPPKIESDQVEGFTPAAAVVRAVRGEAFVSTPTGTTPLQVGTSIHQGAAVTTKEGSSVDLFLGPNGPVIRITPRSNLQINELSIKSLGQDNFTRTRLFLRSGRILGTVRNLTSPSSLYEIRTRSGRIFTEGGKYDVDSNGQLTVIEGNFKFIEPTAIHLVNAGQTLNLPQASTGFPKRKF
jgi:hypothetical protein